MRAVACFGRGGGVHGNDKGMRGEERAYFEFVAQSLQAREPKSTPGSLGLPGHPTAEGFEASEKAFCCSQEVLALSRQPAVRIRSV